MKGRVAAVVALSALALAALAFPAAVAAHSINVKYEAPLPLVVYVAGAAFAVAMSFLFVSLRERRTTNLGEKTPSRPRDVPANLRATLRTLGLAGWLWIMAQSFFGGNDPAADIGQIVLWIYGWIGVALISALIGPVWAWLDPFSTMHLLLVGAGRRLRLLSLPDEDENEYDAGEDRLARFGKWPAVAGFLGLIWLELVAYVTGGHALAVALLGYTAITLAGMAWFGRAEWRRHAEIFSVWFGLLGRLAPYRLVAEPEDNQVVRRPFASGLFTEHWSRAEIVLVVLGTGAIIFDGLSQTELYFNTYVAAVPASLPPLAMTTLILAGWMALLVGLVFAVARRIGMDAVGAGLLPVAVGYLIAHYFATLLFDGQRILIALNDPLVRGDSFLPYPLSDMTQPWIFLPASLIWTVQLAAVVGGHVVGAWAGHTALSDTRGGARMASQLPLAALMVTFTTITLWSLGQQVVQGP